MALAGVGRLPPELGVFTKSKAHPRTRRDDVD